MTDHEHRAADTAGTGTPLVRVRPSHRFDEAALARYLSARVDGFAGTLALRQFDGGQSNPTFLLECGSRRCVLRKKPPGTLLPSAHQIEREYRVIAALRATAVPVPEPVLLCEDASVIGTAFYVVGFVEGRVFDRLASIGSAAEMTALYESMTDTLAALHAVDWQAVGLQGYGRPEGFLQRQVALWTRQYTASAGAQPDPAMPRLADWLSQHLPASARSAIVHGDYRLGNLMFAPTRPSVAAVLDWELSTIGDPLADLAYLCLPYRLPPDVPGAIGLRGLDLAALGVPDEASVVARYCRAAGLASVPAWPFYLVFSLYRLAAIVQGVYARSLQGNASSSAAASFGRLATLYAATASTITETA